MVRRSNVTLVAIITIIVVFLAYKKLAKKDKDIEYIFDELIEDEEIVELAADEDFVSEEEITLVAESIIEDLDNEAEEALPSQLTPSIGELELSEQDRVELEGLLSETNILALGVSLLTSPFNKQKAAEAAAKERQKRLALDSDLKRKEAEILRQKDIVNKKKASDEKSLALIQEKELKAIKATQELDEATEDVEFDKLVSLEKEKLVSEMKKEITLLKTKIRSNSNNLRKKQEAALQTEIAKGGRIIKDRQRRIQAAPMFRRSAMEKELQNVKTSLRKKLNIIKAAHAKQTAKFNNETTESLKAAEVEVKTRLDSDLSEFVKSNDAKRKIAMDKRQAVVADAKSKHSRQIKEVKENATRDSVKLESSLEDVKTKKSENEEKRSKKPGKVRTSKKGRTSVTSKKTLKGRSFSLSVPSDLDVDQTDAIDIDVSDESNAVLEKYAEVKAKIQQDKSLKNVSESDKEVIKSAGREFKTIKKSYIEKRTEKIKKRRDDLKAKKSIN